MMNECIQKYDLRGPAFASLNGEQRQHRRHNVIITELPTIPNSLLHRRQLVSIQVLEIFASAVTNKRHSYSCEYICMLKWYVKKLTK